MPAPSNLSFETGSDGVATGWTLAPISTYEALADYDGEPWERFEAGWDNDSYLFAFDPVDVEAAEYDTVIVDFIKTVENFEEGWDSNQSYVTALDSPEPDPAEYDGEDFEAFSPGWDNGAGYLTEFDDPGSQLSAGDFDSGGGTAETFESTGWSAGYLTEFNDPGTQLEAAEYDGVGTAYEAFESVKLKLQATIDPLNDQLDVATGHGFVDAMRVTIETGIYPAPLQAGKAYYVAFTGSDHFQLENGVGAGTIDLVETAADALYVVPDPTKFWIAAMVTTAF